MNELHHIDRRTAIAQLSALTLAAIPSWKVSAAEPRPSSRLGLVVYCCQIRRKSMPKANLFEPLTFLKHCHSLGAGGMQANLSKLDAQQVKQLREFAETKRLFIEGIVSVPKDKEDLARFTSEITTARDVGAEVVRTTIMPGRRYEEFKTLEEFRKFEQRGQTMLELAAPIVEKHRIKLAVENHKDQRLDERLALYKQLDSEYIGACVDTGNSFALLDDLYGTIEALAPFAFSVHLKDQALQPTKEGFLLGDCPLGQGSFDLARMVAILKKAKPSIHFSLELITRDPLSVPCLSEDYWATMPQVPGSDLARTLRFVRDHPSKLQMPSALLPEKQLKLEDSNIQASLKFAREELSL